MKQVELPVKEDDVLSTITKRLEIAQQKQNPDFKRLDRYYKLFRNYIPEGKWPWRSKVFIPYAYSTVITLLGKMVSNDPTIEFSPRNEGDADRAKMLSALFSYQWSKVSGFEKLIDWVLTTLIFGKGIVKIYWRFEKTQVQAKRYKRSLTNPLGKAEVYTKNQVLFDGPDFEVVDLLDFFIDPQAKKLSEAAWTIHRTYPTVEELKATKDANGEPIYNLPSDEELGNAKVDPLTQEGLGNFKQRRLRVTGSTSAVNDSTVERVEVLEHWTRKEVTTIANQKWVIRREENPFWHQCLPFVEMIDTPLPFDFYKMGSVEPIERLQHALNDLVNQRIDNVSLVLNRMWKVAKTADVDEHELVSRPGGVVHTGQMDGLEPIVTPDVTAASYSEENNIKHDIQITTGVSDQYTSGVNDAAVNRTATGAKIISEETSTRVKFKMKYLDVALRELGTLWHKLDEQFIDSDQVLRITGSEGTRFVRLSPEDIIGDFDIIPVSGSTEPINKQAQATQYLNWFQQMIATYPIWGRQVQVNWHEVLTKFSDKFGIDHLEVIFPAAAAPLQPGMGAGGQVGVVPEQGDMTPAESMPQGNAMPQSGAPIGGPAQVQSAEPSEKKEQDKVSVSVKDPATAIELLVNRGELTRQQADQLHQVTTMPQAQGTLLKHSLAAKKLDQQGQMDVIKQKHSMVEMANQQQMSALKQKHEMVSLAQGQQQNQAQNEQAMIPHRMNLLQTLMSRIPGVGTKTPPEGGEA